MKISRGLGTLCNKLGYYFVFIIIFRFRKITRTYKIAKTSKISNVLQHKHIYQFL